MTSDKFDLENDLHDSELIQLKVKDIGYAQNLYAALCNMQWQRSDVWPVLKNEFWSCSWRHAGAIVADLRYDGDYMDWYCTGIGAWTEGEIPDNFVAEGVITEEIRHDLAGLGWHPVPYDDKDSI